MPRSSRPYTSSGHLPAGDRSAPRVHGVPPLGLPHVEVSGSSPGRHVLALGVVGAVGASLMTLWLLAGVPPQPATVVLVLVAGGVLALVPFRTGRQVLRDTRNRAWLAAAGALVLTGVVGLAVQHLQTERRRAADETPASASTWAARLPRSPAEAANLLLKAVADGDPTVCTVGLSPTSAAQLAAAAGAPDCPSAVHALAGQVVDAARYPRPGSAAITVTPAVDGHTQIVDACHLSWGDLAPLLHGGSAAPTEPPGPQIGQLVLTQVLHRGYQIVAYTPC